MRRILADDRGQALVLVGASIFVLLGSLALVVDWGYGLSVRRGLQNAADAAALGVGRALATSTVVIDGQLRFMALDGQLYTYASTLATANYGLAAAATFTLEYGDSVPTWTASGGASSTAEVPRATVYVRVKTRLPYRSLVASVLGFSQLEAATSARVRLAGAPPPTGPVIALARHFHTGLFSTTCPGACADPSRADPIELWRNGQDRDLVLALDLSRYSHSESTTTDQLFADWDRTGSPAAGTPLKTDLSGRCSGGLWDTAGNEDDNRENERCSVPNWYYYSFGGTISLDSNYAGVAPPREAPTTYPAASRTLCSRNDASWLATYGFIPTPRAACDRGDWIEVVSRDIDGDMADALTARIADLGADTILSSRHGKALTILVFLWDCGEEYRSGDPAGDRWDLLLPGGGSTDCTDPSDNGINEPDRAHIFAVVPFTVYEDLVDNNDIQGFWGGWYAPPPSGPPLPLWVFANTAYLVPDE